MISKELLSEVLGYKPFKIDKIKRVDGVGLTLVLLNQDGTVRSYQNIYELAHKCKEWAKSKGYYMLSGYDNTETPEAIINHSYSESGCYCEESSEAETECEAIFKACQWILKKVNNDN